MNRRYTKRHVVIIDDSTDIHDLLRAILEDDNWIVTGCGDAERAVQCVRDEQPDVVLLDLRLTSSYAGWDILRELQDDRVTARIPVILFTGDVQSLVNKEPWLEERGIKVLSKPFAFDDLYHALESVVREAVPQARA